ncbi:hypothetical protein HPB49_022961 [Dermacentor silvarum]|uniref:Uncharacterized protein n=1 Tax=Dermacentor silvarum TaxID=543639 RepID=A0ACB8DGF8_DERSI|nr:hypothetical protein HPB49_022961 [Dermacentor silvarum]
MPYHVDGEDISPEKAAQDQGWRSVGVRRVGAKTRTANSNAPSPQPGARRGKSGGAALKSRVLRAGRMPSLSRNDIKIVIRPRGGMGISKIGAFSVSDAILAAAGISLEYLGQDTLCPNYSKRENASRYVRMRQILISGKGVIHNIPLQDGPDVIDAKIANTNNPLALAAKRIAQTGTVIVRSTDIVYRTLSGMDRCSFSARSTASKSTRRRRNERAKMAGADTADEFQASSTLGAKRKGRSRSRSGLKRPGRSGSRSRSRGRACSLGRSSLRPRSSYRPGPDTSGWIMSHSHTPTSLRSKKPTLSWADMTRGRREAPRGDDLRRFSHHANELEELCRVNQQLRKENARVKQEMSRLAAEMTEIRKLALSPSPAQPASVPVPVAIDRSEASHGSSAPKR